ncbi:SAP domain-containing protein [bacterium]|nr:MAG: SAP domain-containing protein [bacterium]
MQLTEVKKMAKTLGIKAEKLKKLEMIRAIQAKEGNFPCFGTAKDYCDQLNCLFREDCLGKNCN